MRSSGGKVDSMKLIEEIRKRRNMPLVNKKSKYFTDYMFKLQISLENRVPKIPAVNIWGWIEWWYHITPFTVNLNNNFFCYFTYKILLSKS